MGFMLKNFFVCPETKSPVKKDKITANYVNNKIKNNCNVLLREENHLTTQIDDGYSRKDGKIFFPVYDGIPSFLPFQSICIGKNISVDKNLEIYGTVFEEMKVYDSLYADWKKDLLEKTSTAFGKELRPWRKITALEIDSFPSPKKLWLDAAEGVKAQFFAYKHLLPIKGKRILQIGGHGSHAIKFLLAGAKEAIVLSPMRNELLAAKNLAKEFGVEKNLLLVQGMAEIMPFKNESIDRIYAGGVIHHTKIKYSAKEIARVLNCNGKAAFVEPTMTPQYDFLINHLKFGRHLGMESGLSDQPLSNAQVKDLLKEFRSGKLSRYRALFHFPLTGIQRCFHAELSLNFIEGLEKLDEFFAKILPVLQEFSPIGLILVEK